MAETLPFYVLKRNSRSHRIRVSVYAGGRVSVSAPHFVSEAAILSLLRQKSEWLRKTVARFKKIPPRTLSLRREKNLFAEYKYRALACAETAVKRWSARYGFSVGGIAVRNSRSRWGSCSAAGRLSFNYKIVFLPEHLRNYLVVHEVCHLREHNHSRAFWALVAETFPEYKILRRELRQFERSSQFPPPGI